MTGIVFADNNQWAASGVAYLLFAVMLYVLGTAAYRLSPKDPGRVEAHYLLGLRTIDLRNGFTVRPGIGVLVLRANNKRCRINRGLGPAAALEEWLHAAQAGSTVSGNG
ncbi:MAG: hypothetical protein QOK28_269 [Actinomycetota bacterium]|jgi:hypothetical protein